jgi:hypothetical protein
VYEKVVNQSNLELLSLSLTRSSEPPHIQIDVKIAYDLLLDDLHMHGNLRI